MYKKIKASLGNVLWFLAQKGGFMAKYTIKKILGIIPMLLLITFIIYWLLDLTPGDPISYLMDPEALARLSTVWSGCAVYCPLLKMAGTGFAGGFRL